MGTLNDNQPSQLPRSGFVTFIGVLMAVFAVMGILSALQFFIVGSIAASPESIANLAKAGIHRDWLTVENLKSFLLAFNLIGITIDLLCLLAAISLLRRNA